jgi:ATP-dependent DNA helicase MPH1
MCFRSLTEEAEGGSSDKPSALNKDSAFQALMDELRLQKSRGFAVHPKLEKLKTLVVNTLGSGYTTMTVQTPAIALMRARGPWCL